MRRGILEYAAGLMVVLAAVPALAAVLYQVTDLGTLGGAESAAYAINDSGEVVGYSLNGQGLERAFRTAPSSPINPSTDDLGTLGGSYSRAYGINAVGQVVGYAGLPGSADGHHAFRTAPNARINSTTDDLGTLGGTWSVALAINASGQVVGDSKLSGASIYSHAFRTGPNQPINPATDRLDPDGWTSGAYAINGSGQVAGWAWDGYERQFAIRSMSDGSFTYAVDLGGLRKYAVGWAHNVNASGQAVGIAYADNDTEHAFRTAPNARINAETDDLGALGPPDLWSSNAWGINDRGEVVGSSWLAESSLPSHAFLYDGVKMVALEELIDPALGWALNEARDINNLGQIVGWGTIGGQTHAFLLTPIPEPGGLLWGLAGILLLAHCRANVLCQH